MTSFTQSVEPSPDIADGQLVRPLLTEPWEDVETYMSGVDPGIGGETIAVRVDRASPLARLDEEVIVMGHTDEGIPVHSLQRDCRAQT